MLYENVTHSYIKISIGTHYNYFYKLEGWHLDKKKTRTVGILGILGFSNKLARAC